MDHVQQEASVTTAPPPPTEVKVRTMRSDLAAMTASGGGLPQFSNVHVAGLAARVGLPQEAVASANRTESKGNLVLIAALMIVLVVLGIVGWMVYLKFR